MNINADFSSETELRDTLDNIYSQAKTCTNFHGIFEVAFNEITIVTAIHKIKANHGANTSGVDRVKMNKYLLMDRDKLIDLIIKTATYYQPKPVRRVYIKKANGKLRPLGIPTILDRIIQECVRTAIEPILEAKFYDHSYGFRKYRATKYAVKQVLHFATSGKAYIAIEGDIKGYFDNIDHHILLQKLWRLGIKDKRILKIICQMLKAGYVENDLKFASETGTPQGGIISPLLANVYLNDFDWLVGRRYVTPHLTGVSKQTRKMRERLKRKGRNPCYLVRYADDWIILTQTKQEAGRLLEYLRKYFKVKLKLNLSEEKTVITDLREKPAKFLGYNIIVGRTRDKPNGILVAKNYPNPEEVNKQIHKICNEIKTLKVEPKDEYKVLQITKINSIIEGIAEYWKTGICKKTLKRIDYNINQSAFRTFKYLYPETYMEHKVRVKNLSNRPDRHNGYNYSTFAVNYQGFWVGITIACLTHAAWVRTPFNQKMSPYTKEGRSLYELQAKKKLALDRTAINTDEYLRFAITNTNRYNFEYYMNREYAYNRDKGKCRICRSHKFVEDMHCHHNHPKFPLGQINKVNNLAWLCKECHWMVHGKEIPEKLDNIMVQKINQFRKKLETIYNEQ